MANTQVVIEFTGDPSGLKPVSDALTALGQLTREQQQQFAKALEDGAKRIATITDNATQSSAALNTMSGGISNISKAIGGQAIKNGVDLFTEFTDVLKDCIKEAQGFSDKIKNTAGSVVKGAEGIKAGFEVVQKTLAASGIKSQELEKALQKVNNVISVFKSAQEQAANASQAAASGLSLLSAAQKAYAFVVGASTGAMKVFRLALAATGIGLVIIAVGTLVANWEKLSNAVKTNSEGWQNFKKILMVISPPLYLIIKGVEKLYENLDNLKKIAAGAMEAVSQGFSSIGDIAGNLFSGDFSAAFDDAANLGRDMSRAYSKGYIQEEINQQKERIKVLQEQTKQSYKETLSTLEDVMKIRKAKGEDTVNIESQIFEIRKNLAEMGEGNIADVIADSLNYENKLREDAAKKQEEADKARIAGIIQFREDMKVALELGIQDRIDGLTLELELTKDNVDKQIELIRKIYTEKRNLAKLDKDLTENGYKLKIKRLDDDEKEEIGALNRGEKAKQGLISNTSQHISEQLKKRVDAAKKAADEEIELEKKKQEEIKQAALQGMQTVVDAIFEIQQQQDQAEFDAQMEKLQQQQEAELSNANLTEGQKIAIKEKYRQQEANLKRQQFAREKEAALIKAAIDTALAVIKGLADSGYIGAILAGITGAAQIAIIAAQPTPQFAKGTEFVNGPGTATSDSITARLSKGERVVPAAINAQLNGIPNDMLPQLAAYANMIPDIPQSALNQLALSHSLQIDYNKMGEMLADKLAKNPMLSVSIDKNGLQTLLTRGNRKTNMLNAKYRV